jgi:hypothetical protein
MRRRHQRDKVVLTIAVHHAVTRRRLGPPDARFIAGG